MRKGFAIVSALIGGYLLWKAFKFFRVSALMQGSEIDGALMTLTLVLAGVGVAFLALGWWLFREPPARPPASRPDDRTPRP